MLTIKTKTMVQTENERLQQVILSQRTANQLIAKAIGCDERTAYGYSVEIRTGLNLPIANYLLVLLATLRHKIGAANYGNSFLQDMINSKASKTSVKNHIQLMQNNPKLTAS